MTARLRPTESGLQETVVAYARLRGWLVQHTRPAQNRRGAWSTPISGDPGFPDLVLVRRGRVVFAELKSPAGRLTPEQKRWGDELAVFAGSAVAYYVWRPADWPEIEATLK